MRKRREIALALGLVTVGMLLSLLAVPSARAETFVDEDIDEDTTWRPEEDPYVIVSTVTVKSDARLTIEAGVTARFSEDAALTVQGDLKANGTESNEIRFTSNQDAPEPGDYDGITFEAEPGLLQLNHVRIEYARNGLVVASDSGAAVVADSAVRHGEKVGIKFTKTGWSPQTIRNVTFVDVPIGIRLSSRTQTNIDIAGNQFVRTSDAAIYDRVSAGEKTTLNGLSITDNEIERGGGIELLVKAHRNTNAFGVDSRAVLEDIDISGNSLANIDGTGISLLAEASGDCKYCSPDTAAGHVRDVQITSNRIVNATRYGIRIEASGNAEDPKATLRNIKVANNHVNGSGVKGMLLAGNAYEIGTYSEGFVGIENVDIGNNEVLMSGQEAIRIRAANLTEFAWGTVLDEDTKLVNVTIHNNIITTSGRSGIYVLGESPKEHGNRISSNEIALNQNGVEVVEADFRLARNSVVYNHGIGVHFSRDYSNNSVAENNTIARNGRGMNVSKDAAVRAEHNYWGAASGPYHESINPQGKGNPVNGDGDDLDFVPWAENPIGEIQPETEYLRISGQLDRGDDPPSGSSGDKPDGDGSDPGRNVIPGPSVFIVVAFLVGTYLVRRR